MPPQVGKAADSHGNISVLVVVDSVGVVVVLVVVQPPSMQVSQQLGTLPTQALSPCGAAQCASSFLTLHFVFPA